MNDRRAGAFGAHALRSQRHWNYCSSVREIVLGALVIPGMQLHLAARARIIAGPAGDRHHRVLRVEERPLDRDLPAVEHHRPDALPRLAHNRAHAKALIRTELLGIRLVVDRVPEPEQVADSVARVAEVIDGVAVGMFDKIDRGRRCPGPRRPKRRNCDDQRASSNTATAIRSERYVSRIVIVVFLHCAHRDGPPAPLPAASPAAGSCRNRPDQLTTRPTRVQERTHPTTRL